MNYCKTVSYMGNCLSSGNLHFRYCPQSPTFKKKIQKKYKFGDGSQVYPLNLFLKNISGKWFRRGNYTVTQYF